MKATMRLENSLRLQGHNFVCGIDEVGRGCLAGPLVAAAVILPRNWKKTLRDSKLLTAAARQKLNDYILAKSLASGIGWVSNVEIDEIGLTEAVRLAYLRALEDMNQPLSIIIIDGNYDYLSEFGISQTMVRADQKVSCVAAASIIAKVARDDFMKNQPVLYKAYGFEKNVGYGTPSHVEAIIKNGASKLHRKSFCKRYL